MHLVRVEVPLFIALMVSWVHGQGCGNVVLTENRGKFTSPNYPKTYDHKLNCKWTINAPLNHFVRLTLNKVDLKNPFFNCDHDFITVDNGTGISVKYCSLQVPEGPIMSEKNVMKILLKTDDFFRNGIGFEADYEVLDKDGNPLDKQEEDDEYDDETGKAVTTLATKVVAKPLSTSAPKTEKAAVTTTKKPRKPRKGGKKKKRSKEERERRRKLKRERKLRKQRERAERRKNRKGKGRKRGKKAKRGARARATPTPTP